MWLGYLSGILEEKILSEDIVKYYSVTIITGKIMVYCILYLNSDCVDLNICILSK